MSEIPVLKVLEPLGVVIGFALTCTVDGQDYYDLNIDRDGPRKGERVPEHIPEDEMLQAALDFGLLPARPGNIMHMGADVGQYPFIFPLTAEIADALEIKTRKTGLIVGYKPPPDILDKFRSGELRGFSIEGTHSASTEIS